MPIVNREVERKIVEEGRRQGKSDDFIKQAVLRYREREGKTNNTPISKSVEVSKIDSPVKKPPATPFGLVKKQNNILTNPELLKDKSTFNVPEEMRPQPESLATKAVGGALDVGIGVGKGVASTIKGAASLGERGLQAGLQTILPKSLEDNFGVDKPLERTSAEKLIGEKYTTPTNTAQKIGFGAEQIGEFFIPGGASAKVGKAMEGVKSLSKMPKLAKAFGFAGKVATEGALATGQTALQEGEINSEAKKAGKFGLAFPVAGAVGSKVLKGGGKLFSEVFGKSTGAGSQAIKEAFNNPNVMKYAREAGKNGVDEVMTESLQSAKQGLQILRKARGDEYAGKLSQLDMGKSLEPVLVDAKKAVVNFADDLDTIVEGKNVVDKAISDVNGWQDASSNGLDILKRRLQSYENQLDAPGKASAKRIVSSLKDNIRSGLNENIPGYQNMTKGYHQASNLIDEIEKTLSLGNRKQKETAIRKLLQTVRRDDDSRKTLLEAVSKASGVDITGKVTGTLLSPLMPRGFASGVGPIGIGASLVNPAFWAALIPYGAVSSPRLAGNIASIAGQLSRIGKGTSLPVQLQRLIRQTVLEIQKENQ